MDNTTQASQSGGLPKAKPTLPPKPGLTPKPFSLQKKSTIRSVSAPKTATKTAPTPKSPTPLTEKSEAKSYPTNAVITPAKKLPQPTSASAPKTQPAGVPPKSQPEATKASEAPPENKSGLGSEMVAPDPTTKTTPPIEELKSESVQKDSVIQTNHKTSSEAVASSEQKDGEEKQSETPVPVTQMTEESSSNSFSANSSVYKCGSTRKRLPKELTSKFESGGVPLPPQPSKATSKPITKDDSDKPEYSDTQQSPATPEPPIRESDAPNEVFTRGNSIKKRISRLFDSVSQPDVPTKREDPEILNGIGGVKEQIKNWAAETGPEDQKVEKKPQAVARVLSKGFQPVDEKSPETSRLEVPPAEETATQPVDAHSTVSSPTRSQIEPPKEVRTEDKYLENATETHAEFDKPKEDVQPQRNDVVAADEKDLTTDGALKKKRKAKRRSVRFGTVVADDGGPPLMLSLEPESSEDEKQKEDVEAENKEEAVAPMPIYRRVGILQRKDEETQIQETLKHQQFQQRQKEEESEEARLKMEEAQKQIEEEEAKEKEKAKQKELEKKQLEEERREMERLREEKIEKERQMELLRQRQIEEEINKERLRLEEEKRNEEIMREERKRQRQKEEEERLIQKQKLEERRETELELMRQRKEEERLRQEQIEQQKLKQEAEEKEKLKRLEEEEKIKGRELEEQRMKELELLRQRKEEEERLRQEQMEQQKLKQEAEEKLRRLEEEEKIKRKELEEQRMKELELLRQRKEEEERLRQEQMEQQKLKQEAEEKLRRLEEEEKIKRRELEEQRMKELELLRQRKEEEERLRQEQMEQQKLKQEAEEKLRRLEEEEKIKRKELEEQRMKELELLRQRKAEEERLRQEQMEQQKLKQEAEEKLRRLEEEEKIKRRELEEQRMKELELLRQRKAEEERLRQEQMEQQKLKQEAEEKLRRLEEEEKIKRKEHEEQRMKELELLRQRKAEEERLRQEQMEQQKLKQEAEEEERLRQEDEERKRKELGRIMQQEKEQEKERKMIEKRKIQMEKEKAEELKRKMQEDLEKQRAEEPSKKLRTDEENDKAGENLINFDTEDYSQKSEPLFSPSSNISENTKSPIDTIYDDFSVQNPLLDVDFDDFSVKPRRWTPLPRLETAPISSSKTVEPVNKDNWLVPFDSEPRKSQQQKLSEQAGKTLVPTPAPDSPKKEKLEQLLIDLGVKEKVEEQRPVEDQFESAEMKMEVEDEGDEEEDEEKMENGSEVAMKEDEDEEEDEKEPHVYSYSINNEDEPIEALFHSEPPQQDGISEQTLKPDSPTPISDPVPDVSSEDVDCTDSQREPDLAPFPEISTPLLDTSTQRSKAVLSRRRTRSRPSRSLRLGSIKAARVELNIHDAEKGAESNENESDSEEEHPKSKPASSPPTSTQKVPMFPGLSPAALLAGIKKKTGGGAAGPGERTAKDKGPQEKESQNKEVASSLSQISGSPRLPAHLAGAARVLPPNDSKAGSAASSPAWLKELKSKKRMSQHNGET
ncbi:trichohyalin-like isoform X2 [Girardinichthys multiradiatus]|uniref:trichohyalin-like isoform X2 n=1 Tax=Girardinichthys multiradiatus TaxID=208333 RepID=UPI001FAD617E|nr:trichohyalin-like isoform X2 [Girardinichthys multiradiatus]